MLNSHKYKPYLISTLAVLLMLMMTACNNLTEKTDRYSESISPAQEDSASASAKQEVESAVEVDKVAMNERTDQSEKSSDDIVALSSKQSANWPPFKFTMTPSHDQNGQITYEINFSNQVDWPILDLIFKIPLPKGTRFLRASHLPGTNASFDGVEMTFFTSHIPANGRLTDTFFVLEVTDPQMTVFNAHAWMTWKGQYAGDYVSKEFSIDTSLQPLDWEKAKPRLQLEAGATVVDNVITYAIYAENISSALIWDLKINVPVPAGTKLLSAEPPGEFSVASDGHEVYFTALEITPKTKLGPLIIKVSTNGAPDAPIVTHAWASWRNVGQQIDKGIVLPEGTTRSGDIVVQPNAMQQAVSDTHADAPFLDYDVTNITLEEDGDFFKATFYTNQNLGPVGETLEFLLYIDNDCDIGTGRVQANRGAEYRVRYIHERGEADFFSWDAEQGKWRDGRAVGANKPAGTNMITMWIARDWLNNNQQFCWVGGGQDKTKDFDPKPPVDWVGQDSPGLTQYDK